MGYICQVRERRATAELRCRKSSPYPIIRHITVIKELTATKACRRFSAYCSETIQQALPFTLGEYSKHGRDVAVFMIGGEGVVVGPAVFVFDADRQSGVGLGDFKHLAWFRDHLAKGRRFVGVVLYTGKETLSFGNGMLAVPMSVLWS